MEAGRKLEGGGTPAEGAERELWRERRSGERSGRMPQKAVDSSRAKPDSSRAKPGAGSSAPGSDRLCTVVAECPAGVKVFTSTLCIPFVAFVFHS